MAVDVTAPVEQALESVVGALTAQFTALSNTLTAAVAPMLKFVDALAPASVELFQQGLKDLNATIGVAFLPVIHSFTDALHRAAGILLPAMQSLQEPMSKLGAVMSGLLLEGVRLAAHGLQRMVPIFETLLPLVEHIATLATILTTAFEAMLTSATGLFGGNWADVINALKNALTNLTLNILKLVIQLLGAFGATNAIMKVLASLGTEGKRAEATHGIGGAASNIHTAGIEAYQKELALAAAKATAGGAGAEEFKTDRQVWDAMLTELQSMVQGQSQNKNWFAEQWEEFKRIITPRPGELVSELWKKLRGG